MWMALKSALHVYLNNTKSSQPLINHSECSTERFISIYCHWRIHKWFKKHALESWIIYPLHSLVLVIFLHRTKDFLFRDIIFFITIRITHSNREIKIQILTKKFCCYKRLTKLDAVNKQNTNMDLVPILECSLVFCCTTQNLGCSYSDATVWSGVASFIYYNSQGGYQ